MLDTVRVSSFSMHDATCGELQFTEYDPSGVAPRVRTNVTGAQPPPLRTSVIVVPVIPAPSMLAGLQFDVDGGATSASTSLPVLSTAKVTGASSVFWSLLITTPGWLGAVTAVSA